MNDYMAFIHRTILKEAERESSKLDRTLGLILGDIASSFVVAQSSRTDYIFSSTYDTVLDQKHLKAIGILKSFIILEIP
jgi:hypothetical protein